MQDLIACGPVTSSDYY